jgi:hypothetical protein
MESLSQKLDTSKLANILENLISNYKDLKTDVQSLKTQKNDEIISLVKTLTVKLTGENKLFEKKQMQLLNALQSKFEVQARQIEIFRKQNKEVKEDQLKVFLSKKKELFSEMDDLTESVSKLSSGISNEHFEKGKFMEEAIEKKNKIILSQKQFKEKFTKFTNPMRETVLGAKELVKVLQSKIRGLETDKIIKTLEEIQEIL